MVKRVPAESMLQDIGGFNNELLQYGTLWHSGNIPGGAGALLTIGRNWLKVDETELTNRGWYPSCKAGLD
jgi:hypothetical protein